MAEPINDDLVRLQSRVSDLEDALKWIMHHNWHDVHIGKPLKRLSLIASDRQVEWLRGVLGSHANNPQ